MAAETVAGHIGVIKYRTGPRVGAVTAVALVAAGNMVGRSAPCGCPVVTTEAGSTYRTVIHPDDRFPDTRAVTVFTRVVG